MEKEIERAQDDVLESALAVHDEEDAVFLYRCTKLAEKNPDLLNAIEMRRATMADDALADRTRATDVTKRW